MASPNQAFSRPSSGTPRVSKKLHYIIIASMIPTFAFDIPIAAKEHNTGAILGIVMVGISGILSIYRSGLPSRMKPYGQSYEYQALFPNQDTLERDISNMRVKTGQVGETQKAFFALIDFLFGSLLSVSVVLLYCLHGGGRWWHEPSPLIIVKTWGSWPIILVALIHAYLFFHTVFYAIMTRSRKSPPVCFRCQAPMCENSPPPSEPATARPPVWNLLGQR